MVLRRHDDGGLETHDVCVVGCFGVARSGIYSVRAHVTFCIGPDAEGAITARVSTGKGYGEL